jgi:jumonji domain-containing protein 7
VSSLHRDPYENIYTVIRGKKIFKLLPPTYRGKIVYKEFPVVRCHFNQSIKKWERKAEKGIDSVRWIENGVEGVEAEPIIVEVEPGETLYLPAGWFHQVHQEDITRHFLKWTFPQPDISPNEELSILGKCLATVRKYRHLQKQLYSKTKKQGI